MTSQNTKNQNKTSVYFIPGMAANTRIFERIHLDEDLYQIHYIEWLEPIKNESLHEYSQRISREITAENPVLVGVSFGGIVAQEIARMITVKQVIIISSIKNSNELPAYFKWVNRTYLYKIFPNQLTWKALDLYARITSDKKLKNRIKAYDKYLTVRSNNYLRWCLKTLAQWQNETEIENIVHIHGKKDHIFPYDLIKNAIIVENADHALVLTKATWLNQRLHQIILDQ